MQLTATISCSLRLAAFAAAAVAAGSGTAQEQRESEVPVSRAIPAEATAAGRDDGRNVHANPYFPADWRFAIMPSGRL